MVKFDAGAVLVLKVFSAAITLFLAHSQAYAVEVTIESEKAKLIRVPTAVGTLCPTFFGDKIDLYNGTLEFQQTDVSLAGKNKSQVGAGRRLVTGSTGMMGKVYLQTGISNMDFSCFQKRTNP